MSNPMGQMMGGMMQNMMTGMMQQVMGQLMQRFGGGMGMSNDPEQMMKQIMQNQEVQQKAGPLINGKNPEQLNQTFRNMCKENGINPEEFAQKMGVTLPK